MSWDDPNDDPRKNLRKWFGDFLPEEAFQQIEEMMKHIMSQIGDRGVLDPESLREFMQNPQGINPFVLGFKMRVGPDGKPIIQKFGNTSFDMKEAGLQSQLEPLVDVIEEDNEIVVVVELPGVEKDQIKVRIKGRILTIHVENPERPYHKEIELPSKVKKNEASSYMRNGVLEVRFTKA